MTSSAELRLTTGAKVNLFLRVVGRRPDGFHELESIFQGLDFGDRMEVQATEDGSIEIAMEAEEGSSPELPRPEENIVAVAARRLQKLSGSTQGARIRILKRIPVAGGMGGGSSNAAGVLVALDRLWGLSLGRTQLLELGAEVGSDVPFCIGGGPTSLVTGRGEKLAALAPLPLPLWFVLGISDQPLLTADVYAALDDHSPKGPAAAPMTLALGAGDVVEVAQLLHNDLEPAAFHLRPGLRDDKQALLDAGALGACVSGSGPTLFGLVRDERSAREVEARISSRFDRVIVCSSGGGCVSIEETSEGA